MVGRGREVMVRGKWVSMAALQATITKCNVTLKESVEYLPTQYNLNQNE